MYRGKVIFLVMVALAPLVLGGCFLNMFQTARTLDQGRVLLAIGAGVVPVVEGAGMMFSPQAQLGIGLAEGFQGNLQVGFLGALGEEPGFGLAGIAGELKFRVVDEPEALALALGFGGGWGVNYLGWGVHGTVYLDSNIPFLPLYLAWRPFLSLGGEEVGFGHQFAGGVRLALSEAVTVLLEADYYSLWNLWSPGASVSLTF